MADIDTGVKRAVLRQLGAIPRLKRGDRDELMHTLRTWCATQRVPEVCGTEAATADWLIANPGWQPPQFHGYKRYPEEMKYMPKEIEVAARSMIPLWYCDERNCYKIPCKVDNPFGAAFSIHDGRYSESRFGMGTPPDIIYLTINTCGRLTRRIPKEWETNSDIYTRKKDNRYPYRGNVFIDLCTHGKIHVTIIHYPKQTIPIHDHMTNSPW